MGGGNKSAVVQVVLSAKDQGLISEMVKAELAVQRTAKAADEHASAFKEMSESVEQATKAIKGFVLYEVGEKAVELITDMVKEVKEFAQRGAEFADAQDRMARNLGISATAMAAFSAMEAQADLEAGSLAHGLAKMQQTISDAATAGSSGEKTLAKLGLRFSDLAGLGADDQFKIIAEAISHVGNAGERTAATVAIFDRAGKDLVGTLSQGKAAFDEAAEAAKKYGTVIDASTAARILKAEDLIKEMALKIKGYEQQAAGAMAEAKAVDAAMQAEISQREVQSAQAAASAMSGWRRVQAFFYDMSESSLLDAVQGKAQTTWRDIVTTASQEVKKAGEVAAAEAAKQSTAEAQAAEAARIHHVQEQALIDARLAGIVRYLPLLKQQEAAETKAIAQMVTDGKKAEASYLGAMGVVEKFGDAIVKAKAAAMEQGGKGFNFPRGQWDMDIKADEEWRKKDPASDPRVTYLVAVRELEGETWRNMSADEIAVEAKRREAQTARWATPGMDPRLRYEERVSEMIKRDTERRVHDEEVATRNAHMAQLSLYSNFFSNLATLTEDASKQSVAMFYVNQGMQAAAAEVNAWLAYSQIMAAPVLGLGPIEATTMKEGMAGTALAAGQVAVAHILETKPSGRVTGGDVSSGNVYEVNENGPEAFSYRGHNYLITGSQSGHVTPNRGLSEIGRTTVIIHNYSNAQATATETTAPDGSKQIEVLIAAVDTAMASGITTGTSKTSKAMSSTFGINRARGSY